MGKYKISYTQKSWTNVNFPQDFLYQKILMKTELSSEFPISKISEKINVFSVFSDPRNVGEISSLLRISCTWKC